MNNTIAALLYHRHSCKPRLAVYKSDTRDEGFQIGLRWTGFHVQYIYVNDRNIGIEVLDLDRVTLAERGINCEEWFLCLECGNTGGFGPSGIGGASISHML